MILYKKNTLNIDPVDDVSFYSKFCHSIIGAMQKLRNSPMLTLWWWRRCWWVWWRADDCSFWWLEKLQSNDLLLRQSENRAHKGFVLGSLPVCMVLSTFASFLKDLILCSVQIFQHLIEFIWLKLKSVIFYLSVCYLHFLFCIPQVATLWAEQCHCRRVCCLLTRGRWNKVIWK